MPDNKIDKQYDPGSELLPDWSGVPVDDTPEPEGDPHEEPRSVGDE